jgi:hypothetical protein
MTWAKCPTLQCHTLNLARTIVLISGEKSFIMLVPGQLVRCEQFIGPDIVVLKLVFFASFDAQKRERVHAQPTLTFVLSETSSDIL